MRLRIVEILTNAFKPDVRVYKEAKYLIDKGYCVTILCWDREEHDDLPSVENVDGIEVIRFRFISPAGQKRRKWHFYKKYLSSCKKYLKNNDYDYIHCNDLSGAFVGLFANAKKKPMVVDLHEVFETGGKIRRISIRFLLIHILKKSIAGLYENAFYLSDSYKKVRNKLYPLRNYPDSQMVRYMPKSSSSKFRVGFHGWIRTNMESFRILFDAVSSLNDVQVDIHGGGPGLSQIKEWSKNCHNVIIHGPFDGTKELTSLYANTDVVYCGYNKNDVNYQGDAEVVKFYESIVTGTPMIMTEGIGMGEKVSKNGYGVVCDTLNVNDVMESIIMLKDNKSFYNECVKNELSDSYKYKWENAVRILDKIY